MADDDEDEALDQLAEAAGIRPSYWDIFGHYHETSPEAKRSILEALGFDVDDPAALQAGLARLRDDPWRTPLPPVSVHRLPGPAEAAVTLPVGMGRRSVGWTLTEETGRQHSGAFRPDDLAAVDRRSIAGTEYHQHVLPLPADLPAGYHRLRLDLGDAAAESRIIVAPPRCYTPDWVDAGERRWGLASHLYAMRSDGDWGMGDFGTLDTLCRRGGELGAACIGLNPLHALFPDRPTHNSPYSPSSRRFLNPLYIDVTRVPGFERCRTVQDPDFQARLARAREAPKVDYTLVSDLKQTALEALFAQPESRADPAFAAFVEAGGEDLHRFCLYNVLREYFGGTAWRSWPEAYRRPDSPEVRRFARDHDERIAFHAWLQWLADAQLGAAAGAGLDIGLYRDLAVGAAPDGADAWAEPDLIVGDARFGAPPDAFNPLGQDWGMPPPNPLQLHARAYEPFAAMLRANMRHAGALRIDHVMGLMHLYWVPPGATPAEGAYVKNPFDDLLGVLALESHRNECLIIGEDLGTVPPGFRQTMAEQMILSYRLFFFERWDDGLFKRPEAYPELALATATTHDLPTVTGHWLGEDLGLRRRLGLFQSEDAAEAEARARGGDREALASALRDQGLEPDDLPLDGSEIDAETLRALTLGVELFLARTPSKLLMINLDDLTLERDQLNLPGTVEEHPNWQRRLSRTVEDLSADPFVRRVLRAVSEERG